MDTYDKRLFDSKMFAGMIYSGCRMGAWCFGMESRKMYYTTCPNEQEFLMFFTMSGCLDYIFSEKVDKTKPVFLSDSLGMIWVADYIWHYGVPNLAVVIGPVFNSASSIRGIEDSLRRLNFSIRVRNNLVQILHKVPVVSVAMLYQYASMLHYVLTEEMITSDDFQFQHPVQTADRMDAEEAEAEPLPERVSMERVRTVEEELLQMVREGNLNYKHLMQELTHLAGPDDYQVREPQRNNKNTMLIFAALCSRAAMEGGLSPRTAKDMEVEYITKIEQAKTVTELMHISENMMDDFVKKVHQCRSHPEVSRTVQECCSYIQRNLLKPLELSDIAKEVGYTEYYLTKKFYKEMGVRLSDYIKDSRIELSKIWLLTTQKSIQEISDQMYFGTRNYFSKVFRDKVGMTPAAYRERVMAASDGEEE